MKLGIIGLPQAGKSTIFRALTGSTPEQLARKEPSIGTVRVPDERVDALARLFKPKKTVYAHLEYLLPQGMKAYGSDGKTGDESPFSEVRPCDALVHVVRNFRQAGGEEPHPQEDIVRLESDLIFADLVVVEKRIERIELDQKRGKKTSDEETKLLGTCLKVLEGESPLRAHPELASAPLLRGYTLLSAKPVLIISNNDDNDDNLPAGLGDPVCLVRGELEMELARLSEEEAAEFLTAYGIDSSATDRVIRHSCHLLGLVSFFTVVHDEVRCWLIPGHTSALDAAGVIHTDMKQGFIRAEVLAYDDLIAAGGYQQAKKDAKVRLEAKTYTVQDGDVIYFRFNV